MNSKVIDISGQKFHKLTVLRFSHMAEFRKTLHRTGKRSMWECKCDCGNKVILRKDAFAYKSSRTKSCGCWFLEVSRNACLKRNEENNPAVVGDKHWTKNNKQNINRCSKTGRFL